MAYAPSMTPGKRETGIQKERGRAVVRGLHGSELSKAGEARLRALTEVDAQLDRIARLLPAALDGGMSIAEIARLTGVSRPTLYELRGRYSGHLGDLRLSVLQAVATGAYSVEELAARLHRPVHEVEATLQGFMEEGCVDEAFNDDETDPKMEVFLTRAGFAQLEAWALGIDAEEEAEA